MLNNHTISWKEFKPLLNKEGNGLSDQLIKVIQNTTSLKKFIIKKGGFLDIFVNEYTNGLYNEIRELYPDLYQRINIYECEYKCE